MKNNADKEMKRINRTVPFNMQTSLCGSGCWSGATL